MQAAPETLPILLEKTGRIPGQLVGKSPYLQAVQVMAPRALIGSVVQATITDLGTNTLFGVLADEASAPVLVEAGA
jgi:tRNA-2-methylthio-N6-dimethylallyladenosine synthase